MKNFVLVCCLGLLTAIVGCKGETVSDPITQPAPGANKTPAPADDGAASTVELTPDNTKIEFVGKHTGAEPNPRLGEFKEFAGVATIDGTLTEVSVEIQTGSIATEDQKLTDHLLTADFFNASDMPTATFKSTSIKDNGDGTVEITGDLTLLGKTSSVTFPAAVNNDDGLQLTAEFQLDRNDWGMSFGSDKIEPLVDMKITIGN